MRDINDKLYIVLKMAIGFIFLTVGIMESISGITYTYRWFERVEGIEVRVFGVIISLYGFYIVVSAVKQYLTLKKRR